MSHRKSTRITRRLSPIKEERSRRNPSPRRRKTKRKIEESNKNVFTASRIGYQLSRNKNRIFQRSLQPQLRFPVSTQKQNLNLLTRQLNKYRPKYTFKGLGKIIGTRI